MLHQDSLHSDGLRGKQRHLAVFTILLGISLAVLDSTAVTLSLPTITRDLGVTADYAIWVVNAFQLAALVALLPFANWGERITYRRVYLMGTLLWGASSAIACVAQTLPMLIAARALQGLGAAGIMAVNMALVRLTWPSALLGRGIALNSMVVSSATVIGPVFAAVILSLGNWRWLFAFYVPASLLLLVLGSRTLPFNQLEVDENAPSPLDIGLNASVFIMLFLAADSFGRSFKTSNAQTDGLTSGLLYLFFGLTMGFFHLRRQRNRSNALFPMDLLRIPVFKLSILTSIGSFAAQTMTFIVLPFLMLDAWKITPSAAGFLISCWPVGTILSAGLVGRWIGRFHGGLLGGVGLICQTIGLGWLVFSSTSMGNTLAVASSLCLCGVGFGMFQSPNNHTIITSAPTRRAGAASGMVGTARLIGQTMGASLVAMVFALDKEITLESLRLALLLSAFLSLSASVASFLRLRDCRD